MGAQSRLQVLVFVARSNVHDCVMPFTVSSTFTTFVPSKVSCRRTVRVPRSPA